MSDPEQWPADRQVLFERTLRRGAELRDERRAKHRLVRNARVGLIAAVLIASVSVTVLATSKSGPPHKLVAVPRHHHPTAHRIVPWIDQPPPPSLGVQSGSPPRPKTGAPACTAAQLSMETHLARGIMQNEGGFVWFRNVGKTPCLMRGTPTVMAEAPGHAAVVATKARIPSFGEVADTAPGQEVTFFVDVPETCPADPGGGDKGLVRYHSLDIVLPGGGRKVLKGLSLTFQCGMSTTPFFTSKPAPSSPPDPLAHLVPHLVLPETVRAGSTLVYQVELLNPTNRAVPLSPCPGYLEHSSIPTKLEYELNCRTVHSIPARGEVTYEMDMAIPANAPPGAATVFWSLDTPIAQIGQGQLLVIGRGTHPIPTTPLAGHAQMTLTPTSGKPGTIVHITVTSCPPPAKTYRYPTVFIHYPWSDHGKPGVEPPTWTIARHQVGQSVEDVFRIPTSNHAGQAAIVVFCGAGGASGGTGTSAVFTVRPT